jgi:PleD family two-component response regulator
MGADPRVKVLVVDDNPANRLAFEVVLEPDYDVRLAGSGRQALEAARRHEFAVIVLDVRMPEMDGFETAWRLRQMESARFTTILFTSAIDKTLPDVLQGLKAGGIDYLFSPVDPDLLKSKVDACCRLYRMTLTLRKQVDELNAVLLALEKTLTPNDALQAEIERLGAVNEELRRQVSAASFAE